MRSGGGKKDVNYAEAAVQDGVDGDAARNRQQRDATLAQQISPLITRLPLITLSTRRVYIHAHYMVMQTVPAPFVCSSFVHVIHNFYASFHVL